jgi:hypothetical protein
MSKSFIISSTNLPDDYGLSLIVSSEKFKLYANDNVFEKNGDIYIYFEGYFMPRNEWIDRFSNLTGSSLIYELFLTFGTKFIGKIKGFFTIAIITKDNFYVFNDIHSVKRFFFNVNDRSFFVSNSIAFLKAIIGNSIDPLFAAHHALFQHFIFGQTIFKNIQYSEFASQVFLNHGRLMIGKYWQTDSLENLNKDLSIKEFIFLFNKTIKNYIQYFKPKRVAATITGGRDTRSVVASLIANEVSPHLFTFGNPQNRDVIVGKLISESCNLSFSNPSISNPGIENYRELVNRIICLGDSFIHLHRAHRLDAIEKEVEEFNHDMVFVGAMGGDYIKGSSFDDYIVSEFIRENFFKKGTGTLVLMKRILEKHFVNYDKHLLNSLYDSLIRIPLISNREFNSSTDLHIAHDIIGCSHDIQDIKVYSKYIDKVIAPYMDIDIMEALFRTNFSLLSNSKNSNGLLTKYLGGELQANLVTDLCPALARVPYANYYKPVDVSGSKPRYIIKRGIAYIKQKQHPNISGFEYGKWFIDYIEKELQESRNLSVSQYYDFDKMLISIKMDKHLTHEGYWHKYTNAIMFSKYANNLM